MPASWCWLHHIHPWKTRNEWAFRGYSTGWGRRVCLRQSGAVHRGTVGQPSRSSMAQAILSLPPTNLIISLHLKRVQFKILVWKAANQIFSNSPGKPNPSVFSALTFFLADSVRHCVAVCGLYAWAQKQLWAYGAPTFCACGIDL